MVEAGAADGGSEAANAEVSPSSAAAGANVGGDKGTGDDAAVDGSDAPATGADGAKSAKEVVAAETALANDRYKTMEPSAAFNATKPFERFCPVPETTSLFVLLWRTRGIRHAHATLHVPSDTAGEHATSTPVLVRPRGRAPTSESGVREHTPH